MLEDLAAELFLHYEHFIWQKHKTGLVREFTGYNCSNKCFILNAVKHFSMGGDNVYRSCNKTSTTMCGNDTLMFTSVNTALCCCSLFVSSLRTKDVFVSLCSSFLLRLSHSLPSLCLSGYFWCYFWPPNTHTTSTHVHTQLSFLHLTTDTLRLETIFNTYKIPLLINNIQRC